MNKFLWFDDVGLILCHMSAQFLCYYDVLVQLGILWFVLEGERLDCSTG